MNQYNNKSWGRPNTNQPPPLMSQNIVQGFPQTPVFQNSIGAGIQQQNLNAMLGNQIVAAAASTLFQQVRGVAYPNTGEFNTQSLGTGFGGSGGQNHYGAGGRGRDRSYDRERNEDNMIMRKRRRDDRMKGRDKEDNVIRRLSPPPSMRKRSRSPPKQRRRAVRPPPRYMVQVPKLALNFSEGDVFQMRRRYANLYIPSDFFFSSNRWVDVFPPHQPWALNRPCSFHIMSKDAESPFENPAVLEPSDADYRFSAKVMLLSFPGLAEVYQRCCSLTERKEHRKDGDVGDDEAFVHPTRLISFLVGNRGKNETMAIGGPWSPSLDGPNPDKDPAVLVKTAIRTCRALTGIDLSNCTQWYRFVELYYRRQDTKGSGKVRVETVVLYLPDVWSCLPTRLEWDSLQQSYKDQLEQLLKSVGEAQETQADGGGGGADDEEKGKNVTISDIIEDEFHVIEETDEQQSGGEDNNEKEEQQKEVEQPTHHKQLDVKNMDVESLRRELKARNANCRGLKSQLVARLGKLLRSESSKDESDGGGGDNEKASGDGVDEMKVVDEVGSNSAEVAIEEKTKLKKKKKSEISPKEKNQLDEKRKHQLEKRYKLPEQSHLIVHPSKTAKGGKFDCANMSLSILLDYRQEDNKEYSFEVALFAELFNEMLMRDFGFNIFKALSRQPERKTEESKRKATDDTEDNRKKVKKEDDTKKEPASTTDDTEEKAKEEDSSKDEKSEEKTKEESTAGDEVEMESESDRKSRKDKERRKKEKERVKMYTKDRHLLLSFVYFDQTQCGYIHDKDLEDLLYTLGLNVSRAQVRKLISKVLERDSIYYRKLTDDVKPIDESSAQKDNAGNSEQTTNEVLNDEQDLAMMNKKLLPIFRENDDAEMKPSGTDGNNVVVSAGNSLVTYRGVVIDIEKLMLNLERSEKAQMETESNLNDVRLENNRLSEKYSKATSSIKHLSEELRDYKDRLRSTDQSLTRINSQYKTCYKLLSDIHSHIQPVLKHSSGSSSCKNEDKSIKNEEKLVKNDDKSGKTEDKSTKNETKSSKVEEKSEIAVKSENEAKREEEENNANKQSDDGKNKPQPET